MTSMNEAVWKAGIKALELEFEHIPMPVLALFALIPKPGESFPTKDRIDFLRALEFATRSVYGGEKIEIDKSGK